MFEKLKTYFPKTRSRFLVFLIIAMAMVCAVTTGAVYDATAKKVTVREINVYENAENVTVIKTRQDTVSAFMNENNLTAGQYDNINVLPEDKLYDNMEIRIRRGKPVMILTNEGQKQGGTTKATVAEALMENGVHVNEGDEITPERNEQVTENMTITVVSVVSQNVTQAEEIPFETVKQDDASLYKGETKVVTDGQLGAKDVTYVVTYRNGEETDREYVSETVTKEPVSKVIAVGTKEKTVAVKTAARSSAGLSSRGEARYSRKINVTATAYDPSPAQNGGHSRTATGMKPAFGVIAVDPNVIPLGSRVYIESSDGGESWVYGYAIAGDTGGAIKGNRIDLCYNTAGQASAFGRRSATVYILD